MIHTPRGTRSPAFAFGGIPGQHDMTSSTPRDKSRYRVLTRNMVLFVVAASVIPLIVTGVITLSHFREAYEIKVRDHLRELVQKHSQNIDAYLIDRQIVIRMLARSKTLEQLSDPVFLRNRLAMLREEYGGVFVDLGLVDSKGMQINYAGPFNLKNANYAHASWFQKAFNREEFISDVFTGLRGTPHFIVAVKKKLDGRIFVVKSTIDFNAFNALVENISVGRTGFAFIFNREGQFQTKPRVDVILNREPYKKLLTGGRVTDQKPLFEQVDTQGHDSLFAVAPLKGGQWILCLQQETRDAYANLYQTVAWAIAIIFVSTGVVISLAFPLSRQLVGRIREADEQQEVINEKVIETGRLASIGELAAGIAHEINNPVAIMVEEAGWIEDILSEDKQMDEEDLGEIQRAVQQIRTQGGRCKDITFKLLSFARKTDPTVKEVVLNELVEEVVGLLSQKSRFATVSIETELAPDLSAISASPSEMQQVILNLMNNAVDAIGKGGGLVKVITRNQDGKVVFEVTDTGEGIPEANFSRIFDPFFTTKPVGHGTGLGLSICYGIINKLGGDIAVRSVIGQGTSFSIVLPGSENNASRETNGGEGDDPIADGPVGDAQEGETK